MMYGFESRQSDVTTGFYSSNEPVLIVAEAGINHNGSLEIAKQMIDIAVESGVDVIKFQTAQIEDVVTQNAKKAKYQEENQASGETQFQMLEKYHLKLNQYSELSDYCQGRIGFASTAFDLKSLDVVKSLQPKFLKIPSGEITNLPLLRRVGQYSGSILLSTGMSNLNEIQRAVEIIESQGASRDSITILHCTSAYPAPLQELNLKALITIKNHFQCKVGYSDHSLGLLAPIVAVAFGANVIEKHFTLNREMEGPDHKASLEPQELSKMVRLIRETELAIGDGIKTVTPSELENREVARRSIVARTPISKGDTFTDDNLITKRPATGISPMYWDELIGKVSSRNYDLDEMIDDSN